MALLLSVVFVALVFEYINGFHDTANSIATVVSTKVLTPRQAIALAAITNLIGALAGTAVAKTISAGLVDVKYATTAAIICALVGAVLWNLLTWWFGLPSSSSHALIGGLCGATLASADGQWSALIWSKAKEGVPWYKYDGLLYKVVLPMVVSPLAGFLIGLVLMAFLYVVLRNWKPKWVTATFGRAQLLSAAYMGFSHGSNDAQKTMGIITALLYAHGELGGDFHVPFWVVVSCNGAMALGTLFGGWRIIHTMGTRITRLSPMQGVCAETAGSITLFLATGLGVPVSTTQTITGAIVGVGAARRTSAVRWGVAREILIAWVTTMPAAALVGAAFSWLAGLVL